MKTARTAAAGAFALAALAAGTAAAQQSSLCTPGNLLAGKLPVARADLRGNPALLTNGEIAPEGSMWDAAPAVVLETPAATVTYDLGAAYPLRGVAIQADANDVYGVWGSLDGATFTSIGEIATADGHGLRTRTLEPSGTEVRYLKVGEGRGDSAYSISEVQAFCELPRPFPPRLKEVAAPVAQAAKGDFWSFYNDVSSARYELGLALAGLLLLWWDLRLRREGRAHEHKKWRDRALLALGVISAGTYINFGFFHFRNFIHHWDTFHYFVGAKYFKELQYDRLYECVAIGDHEMGLQRRVETRKIMNLHTNELEKTDGILKDPQRCKSHFTPARWEAFKRDISWFRGRVGVKNWEDMQTDHGFNATPVWTILGAYLANGGPATYDFIVALDTIDLGYMLAMVLLIGWAFGWRTACVALLVYATNFPSRWFWNGGSFLRYDWLFYTVATVCLMKKDRPFLAGAALAYAALLRIFPAFLVLGPLAQIAWHLWKERRVPPPLARFIAGGVLASVLLVGTSVAVVGGRDVYARFVENTAKHARTPLTNHMGLRTAIIFRPSEAGRHLRSNNYTDPWSVWKQTRLDRFKQMMPVFFAVVAGACALLFFAVRVREPWVALALGSMMIPVAAELTSYYFAFLIATATLWAKRREAGVALVAVTASTGAIAATPLWMDEQHPLMSITTLVGFGYVMWGFAFGGWDQGDDEPDAPPQASTSKASQASPGSKRKKNKRG